MYTRGVRKGGKEGRSREEARTPQKHVAGCEARRDEVRRFRASEDVAARDVVGVARRGYARSPRV